MTPTFVIANLVAQSYVQDAYNAFPDAPIQPVVERLPRLHRLTSPFRRQHRRFNTHQQPACS